MQEQSGSGPDEAEGEIGGARLPTADADPRTTPHTHVIRPEPSVTANRSSWNSWNGGAMGVARPPSGNPQAAEVDIRLQMLAGPERVATPNSRPGMRDLPPAQGGPPSRA